MATRAVATGMSYSKVYKTVRNESRSQRCGSGQTVKKDVDTFDRDEMAHYKVLTSMAVVMYTTTVIRRMLASNPQNDSTINNRAECQYLVTGT